MEASLLFISVLLVAPQAMGTGMEVLYSWSQVDFTFPSSAVRQEYLSTGRFIPENNVILDVDVWNGNGKRKVFVTLPQFKPGIPISLATVSEQGRDKSPLLQPYPDWSWHQGGSCDGITSVYRTMVDDCGRLWVLDTGTEDSFVGYKRVCPPQILIFDLRTDKLIRRYRFPSSLLSETTQLVTVMVDTRKQECTKSVAYIADPNEYTLYVYSFARDKAWRINNKMFYPCPAQGDFLVNGEQFEMMDGVFGLALGPLRPDGDRTLYFHSLASVHESYVNTSVIRNSSLFESNPASSYRSFKVFNDTRSSQSAVQAMTQSGVLLYTLIQENAIGCWNSHKPFRKSYLDIVAKDDETLQFQTGIKVYGDYVYTVSNRLQNYIANNVSRRETNMRVNVGKLSDILKNTKCTHTGGTDLVFPTDYTL